MEEETTAHLFWHCQRAREVWLTSNLFRDSLVHHFGSVMDMLWNKCRNGGAKKTCQALLQGVLEYLSEYQAYMEVTAYPKQSAEVVVWTPPSPTRYKINVDGAVFKEQKLAGVGILIRDATGQLIGACSKKIEAPLGAIEADAKAVELGLQFAKDMSIQDYTLESDSVTLVNALRDFSPPPLSVVALVYSSVAVSHSFRCVDFAHVGRNGNRSTHLFARHALGIANLSIWVEETPCFLEQALNQSIFVNSSD
ncbi:uncharacterized protein LOC142608919 [Castanea sativa]|uniref:uncharacterized protein LOC142608919 n=1 Tax=Castanea sativa TaxID=21020 RepID=UPI003F65227B